MEALELARWQFAITTIYHFFFVPVSIGMATFVAGCQTAHWRTGRLVYDRMARFWGKLFLIVFALGVATGIVQEFQFGMNPPAARELLVRLARHARARGQGLLAIVHGSGDLVPFDAVLELRAGALRQRA